MMDPCPFCGKSLWLYNHDVCSLEAEMPEAPDVDNPPDPWADLLDRMNHPTRKR